MGGRGAALLGPLRRRGGSREELLDLAGVAWRGVEAPARWQGRWRRLWATRGRQRDGKRRPGSLYTAPASVPSVGGGAEQSREVEVEEKDGFAISKNSRDYSVNQR